jgi:LysM repeat protein
MRSVLFLLVWLGTTPSEQEVVINERESLSQIAKRTLGDAGGASELKAFNGLTSDAVEPGTRLKIPSQVDRAKALSALETARNAMNQVDRTAERREEASAKLREAESLFKTAHYVSAAEAADQAWQLLSPGAAQPSEFRVKVTDDGATTISVKSGPPVQVKAENETQPVKPGESVRVEKGQPPPPAEAALRAPEPRTPNHGKLLKFKSVKGQLGPVVLTWTSVPGARQYEVEVLPTSGEPLRKTVEATRLELPLLAAGRYRWTVRALGESHKSNASSERHFELAEDQVMLRVGDPTWK